MANNGSAYGAAVDAFNTQYNPQVGQSKGSGSLWGSGNPTYSAPVPGSMVITHPSGATITLHPVVAPAPNPSGEYGAASLPKDSSGATPLPSDQPGATPLPKDQSGATPLPSDASGQGPRYPTSPPAGRAPVGPTIPITVPRVGAPPPVFGPPLGAPPPPNPTPPSPVTLDPNSPEGMLASQGFPTNPNQINLRNWSTYDNETKQNIYGLYHQLGGWTQGEIDKILGSAGTAYGGARVGFIAPT